MSRPHLSTWATAVSRCTLPTEGPLDAIDRSRIRTDEDGRFGCGPPEDAEISPPRRRLDANCRTPRFLADARLDAAASFAHGRRGSDRSLCCRQALTRGITADWSVRRLLPNGCNSSAGPASASIRRSLVRRRRGGHRGALDPDRDLALLRGYCRAAGRCRPDPEPITP